MLSKQLFWVKNPREKPWIVLKSGAVSVRPCVSHHLQSFLSLICFPEDFSQWCFPCEATQSQHETPDFCHFLLHIHAHWSCPLFLKRHCVSDGFSPKINVMATNRLITQTSISPSHSPFSFEASTVTYGRTCLCFHSIPGSTGTSCGSRSSLPACRPSCRWSCSGNNTVRQEAMTYPQPQRRGQEEEVSPNRKWPVAWTSVGGPRVRAGLFSHLVVRVWVGLFHRGGEAEDRQEISLILYLIFILLELCLSIRFIP